MEYKRFGSRMVLRIDRGEEVLTQLHRAAEQEGIRLAAVSGLGAVGDFTVGVFVSLVGTITTKDGEFYAHLHMSAGDTEGRVLGGHLNEAVISATCELVLEIMDGTVERRFDPETGLNLMEF